MSKKKIEKIITETSAEAYMINNITPKLEAMKEDISLTRTDQKTVVTTIQSCTDSLKQSFEEMKNTKAAERPVSLCRKDDVRLLVKEQVQEALKGINLKAEVSPESINQMDEQIGKMKEVVRRPPLLSLQLNMTTKVFAIIMALLLILGATGYAWLINTPMYLGDKLYKSYSRLNYPNPGAGYSTAYRLIGAGERKQFKDEIARSEHRERSYIAYRDTLCQLLNDRLIFINRIQYENSERLIDYTDSTDIIKTAHFRKDGSIRITDSKDITSFYDVKTKKHVKWQKLKTR